MFSGYPSQPKFFYGSNTEYFLFICGSAVVAVMIKGVNKASFVETDDTSWQALGNIKSFLRGCF